MIHAVTAIVLLVATALLHWSIYISREAAVDASKTNKMAGLENVPVTVPPFTQYGEDLDPGDDVRELLETSDILMRHYIAPNGAPVLLTIVYAGQVRRSIHFPETCLVGQGWEIERSYTAPVGFDFEARRLVIFQGDRKEAVLYWLKTGDRFTSSHFVNAVNWGREQLSKGTPTSSMIKLSMPILRDAGQTEEEAFAILDDFAGRLGPILKETIK